MMDDEDGGAGIGAGTGPGDGGPPTRDQQLALTGEVLVGALELATQALEAIGRSGEAKIPFVDATPLMNVPVDWLGPETTCNTELNPSNFEQCCGFIHGQFMKPDVERAIHHYLEDILRKSCSWKKGAEVMAQVMKSWGLNLRGPRRNKMTAILLGLALAKKDRAIAEEAAAAAAEAAAAAAASGAPGAMPTS